MKRTILGGVVFCLVAFTWAAPSAHAQLKLAAENISLADTTITPADPSVLANSSSAEIMALDVPRMPSSSYVLLSSTAQWAVNTTAAAPVSAFFRLRFIVTSPAMPPGVVLTFSAVMANFSHSNNGNGESLESGTADDTEVVTRDVFASFLLSENPGTLNAVTAGQVADGMFQQGFHVSVIARLNSRNITAATVSNPNVAFFAEKNSAAK
jgi:hypothetical protein